MDTSAMTWNNTQSSAAKDTEQIRIKHWYVERLFIV